MDKNKDLVKVTKKIIHSEEIFRWKVEIKMEKKSRKCFTDLDGKLFSELISIVWVYSENPQILVYSSKLYIVLSSVTNFFSDIIL